MLVPEPFLNSVVLSSLIWSEVEQRGPTAEPVPQRLAASTAGLVGLKFSPAQVHAFALPLLAALLDTSIL
jgi:hypothetical protein